MIDHRLLVCAALSLLGHFAFGELVSSLPPRPTLVPPERIAVQLVAPPEPAPPPEPPPPPPPLPPPPVPPKIAPPIVTKAPPSAARAPAAHPVTATVHDALPSTAPVADHAVVAPAGTGAPIFGVTMESTSTTGTGPVVPVGNTGDPGAPRAPAGPSKPAGGAPVAAYEVTKMPLPQGRCAGTYTDAAKAAGTEGTVVLDLIVDEHGRARDIVVVTPLANGLTEAAVAALRGCHFQPGERDGQPVAVRVRGFKIRFVMQDAQ